MNMKSNSKYIPYWLTKYNHTYWLNLPNAMELYGHLTNLWEGANQDESYLQYTKPTITYIHSVNCHLNFHSKLRREKSLESAVNYHITENCS